MTIPTGWQCPVCGQVWAYWVAKCTYCEKKMTTATTRTRIDIGEIKRAEPHIVEPDKVEESEQ